MPHSEMEKTSGGRAKLRDKILQGYYPVDTYLPSVRDLAKDLSLSKSNIHNILKYLQEEHLLQLQPRRGAYVLNHQIDRRQMQRIFFRPSDYGTFGYLPVVSELLAGITHGCELKNAELNISLSDAGSLTDKMISGYRNGEWQGVIYSQCQNYDSLIRPLEAAGIPYVLANDEHSHKQAVRVYLDHAACSVKAVARLYAQGHRRIGLFISQEKNPFYSEFLKGYEQGLKECGLPLDPELILTGKFTQGTSRLTPQSRKKIMKYLQSSSRATAVFCIRSYRTELLCDSCTELGLSVPGDLTLFSYDISERLRLLHPEISYIEEPRRKMGETAVNLLQQWITTGERPESVCIPPVIR